MTTTQQQPFVPRVLRSEGGTVAVEVAPTHAPDADGFRTDLYKLVALGQDGLDFLAVHNLPIAPGAMLNRTLLERAPHLLSWQELT